MTQSIASVVGFSFACSECLRLTRLSQQHSTNTAVQPPTSASQLNHYTIRLTIMTSFPQFGLLPTELQTQIWREAIFSIAPRTIIMYAESFFIETPTGAVRNSKVYSPTGPPSLLHACHISRKLSMSRYNRRFPNSVRCCYVWVDFDSDVIDLGDIAADDSLDHKLEPIQRLRVCHRNSDVWWLTHLDYYCNRPDVKELQVVCLDGVRACRKAMGRGPPRSKPSIKLVLLEKAEEDEKRGFYRTRKKAVQTQRPVFHWP